MDEPVELNVTISGEDETDVRDGTGAEAVAPIPAGAPLEGETPVGSEAEARSGEGNNPEIDSGESGPRADGVSEATRSERLLSEFAERVTALGAVLEGRLDNMKDALREALNGPYGKMADAVRRYAEVTDNMDEELKAFRKGLVRKLEQELFQEWFDLYDALRGAAEEAGKAPEKAGELLEGFRTWIEGVLENRKCVKKEAVAGERFDGRKHRVWGERVPTRDAALDGRVAETAKPGFDDEHEMYGGLPDKAMHLRPIHVRLYKYIPETESPSPALAGEGEDGGDGPAE